jgi:hypothetical protein
MLLLSVVSSPSLGPTQSSIQQSPKVKQPGREADHSSASNAAVNNVLSYTSSSPYVFMPWYLIKHRDNFTSCLFIVLTDCIRFPLEVL